MEVRRERRRFTPEYKAEVVALIRSSGKTVGQVSRDLGLTAISVREWVQKAEIDEGQRLVLEGERVPLCSGGEAQHQPSQQPPH